MRLLTSFYLRPLRQAFAQIHNMHLVASRFLHPLFTYCRSVPTKLKTGILLNHKQLWAFLFSNLSFLRMRMQLAHLRNGYSGIS